MVNNWNIPAPLEQEIREIDKTCVYCRCNAIKGQKENSNAKYN